VIIFGASSAFVREAEEKAGSQILTVFAGEALGALICAGFAVADVHIAEVALAWSIVKSLLIVGVLVTENALIGDVQIVASVAFCAGACWAGVTERQRFGAELAIVPFENLIEKNLTQAGIYELNYFL
jgi:hypothetical protein